MHVFIILCYIKENENYFLAFVRLTVNAANNTIQYNTIQKCIALSTHIQHFKQTNIYTIIQFMKTRFSEEHN